jgi:polyhydroxyalkanoate synthesis regulator phasin
MFIKESKMIEIMHQIKKYANGRLYDATDKKYLTVEDMEDFIRTGVVFTVVLSKTDEDITDSVIAKIKEEMESGPGKKPKVKPKIKSKVKPKAGPKIQAKPKSRPTVKSEPGSESPGVFSQLLLKGGGMFAGYAREYADLLYNALSMAEEELDKRVKQMVKVKEMSESEAGHKKKEVMEVVENLKNWLGANVEERIHDIVSTMNLATQSQVEELTKKINGLNKKLAMLERMEKEREDSAGGIAAEKVD